jgi:hypothetical protein
MQIGKQNDHIWQGIRTQIDEARNANRSLQQRDERVVQKTQIARK